MNEQAPEGVRADPPSGVERLIAHVKTLAPVRTAVVHPCDALSLGGKARVMGDHNNGMTLRV